MAHISHKQPAARPAGAIPRIHIERLESRVLLSTTWTVTSPGDDGTAGTFRYAVNHSSAGDVIQFGSSLFATSTQAAINLNSASIEIPHDLSIVGPGSLQLELWGASPLFVIDAGASVSISEVAVGGGASQWGEGGAARINSGGALSLSNCDIQQSRATDGAGVYNEGAFTVTGCTFENNFAAYSGGAIFNDGNMTVTNCNFDYNGTVNAQSVDAGGAIENAPSGSAVVSGSYFTENTAGRGGAIDNAGQLSVSACTFASNTSNLSNPTPLPYGGGAIRSTGTMDMANSTLAWNWAGGEVGGGIDAAGPVTLTNCTLAYNMALGGSGINAENPAVVTLNNTIVVGNIYSPNGGSPGPANDIAGTVSGAYNLIGTGGSGGLSDGIDGNRVGVANAGLAPLTNNGGPTPTLALEAGSPAFDAGSTSLAVDDQEQPLMTDERGRPRVYGKSVDIGAYEAQVPAPPTQPSATAGADEVLLTWTASPDAATYNICRGTTAGGEAAVPIATGVTMSRFDDVTAAAGPTYFYTIAAVNAAGESVASDEVSCQPFPPVINGTAGNDSIRLERRDLLHIHWTMGAQSGQFLIHDPNGLTINGNGGTDSIVNLDTQANSFPDRLIFNGTFNIVARAIYPLQAGQTWDIKRSTIYIQTQPFYDPRTWVAQDLAAGYNGGRWNGVSSSSGVITSSAAAADRLRRTGIGYVDVAAADTLELKYTLYGDANLDGTVNLGDLSMVTRQFGQSGGWDAGDFNYDQTVNLADLLLLSRNFGQTTTNVILAPSDFPRAAVRRA